MNVAMYLRKSRADEEAEKLGEHETLNRHRSTLLKVAKKLNLNIVDIKEELISGESISYRPKMLELLEEVKAHKYDAVLVMDIDRLGRGNMQDQGLILDTFKQSKTKIITPDKSYDLNDEFDEEMTEFKTFFARRELKMITKRMQRGRIKSVEEGKFLATNAPLGYKFEYVGKDRLLVIDEEKSHIVKMIYDMYLDGNGAFKIANHLNILGYKTSTGRDWYEKGIRDIIKNKVYCGYIVWNKVERKRNSQKIRPQNEQIESVGKHDAIISEEIWNRAQEIRLKRSNAPVGDSKKLTNQFAGLVKCKLCGATMTASPSTYKNIGYVKFLMCKNCYKVAGTRVDVLEEEILATLKKTLEDLECHLDLEEEDSFLQAPTESSKISIYYKILRNLEKESVTLVNQKENLHDLLERGVYDIDTYLDRSKILADKITTNNQSIEKVKRDIELEDKNVIDIESLVPALEHVLKAYPETNSIIEKNRALKSVIGSITYYKEKGKRNASFELDIELKSSNKY